MGTSSDNFHQVCDSLNVLSATELNDQILSLPTFLCRKCNQLLLPPIRLLDGFGNICGKCDLNDKSKTILHNSALEVILEHLAIPCPNKSRGCNRHFDYYNIAPHLLVCPSRSYSCPYNVLENCQWQGASSSIGLHCIEKHPEDDLLPDGNSFEIEADIGSTNHQIRLLNFGNEKFILHVHCDLPSSSLYYVMYYLGNPGNMDNFEFAIEQIGKNGASKTSLHHESNKINLYDKFSLDVNAENALKIDLQLLQPFVLSSPIETTLKITSKNDGAQEIDEALLSIFECPVCNNYMKPPIFQCLSGHSLCNNCRPKLGQCPTCRTGFGNTRNYALEVLGNKTKFPCLYRDLGCRMILQASEINKHEPECNVKPYNCPFLEVKKCPWEGTYSRIATHLLEHHRDKTKLSNHLEVHAVFSYESTSDLNCLIYNGDIFRVCHKYDRGNHNVCWAVQYIGSKLDAKKYKCEIGMVDGKNENRKLSRMDVCQELTSYDAMFKQAIVLPLSLVSTFSTSEGVTYICKVTQMCA